MKFELIMIEKDKVKDWQSYTDLDMDREVIYEVYEITYGEYGNERRNYLLATEDLDYAKKFLRSCRLVKGITLDE